MPTIVLTNFARRQWKPGFSGTSLNGVSEEQLLIHIRAAARDPDSWANGYASFCKHIWLRNNINLKLDAGVMQINAYTESYLRSGYIARREDELPVLTRWFLGLDPRTAMWADIVLYSSEQLASEDEAIEGDWGIVTINGEMERQETPITPATQMRNALGVAEGGSGVPIDRDKYLMAVDYWDRHAVVRSRM